MESEPRQPSTSAAAGVAALVAGVMIAQQVAGKATRDAFFLSHYEATALPSVMVASAGLSLGIVLLLARLMRRFTPRRVVPGVFALNALLFGVEYVLAQSQPRMASVVVYLHTAALGAAVISVFWSVINERFDPHTAKRVIARIAAGAAAGGVVGGAVAWQASKYLSLTGMLLILVGANVICLVLMPVVSRGGTPPLPSHDDAPSGLEVMRKESYLRQLALLVVLLALGEAFVDYVMKASAAAAYGGSDRLITFFAIFHTATGITGFLVQAGAVRRALQGIGLVGAIAAYPLVIVAGSAIALIVPHLWSAVALRGAAAVSENSFFRTGYELAYTPLPAAEKRSTKTIIDVAVQKVGTAMGGGLVLVVLAVAGAHAYTALLVVPLVLCSLTLVVAGFLHRGYVAALARSLREGAVKLEGDEVVDLTTRLTLTEASMALDRQTLLREIEALRLAEGPTEPAIDPLLEHIAALRGHDVDLALESLELARPIRPELVGHVIGLLGATSRLSNKAMSVLSEVADRSAGQLVDALLDDKTPLSIRRRLPRVLAACHSQRAVDGLVEALGGNNFRVRDRCAAALLRVVERGGVTVSAPEINRVAIEQLQVARSQPGPARQRSLEYVFTLLSLTGDRESLQLAFAALRSDDTQLRGTGLEYVENVVPGELYRALEPFFSVSRQRRPRRPEDEIVQELLTSMTDLRPIRG